MVKYSLKYRELKKGLLVEPKTGNQAWSVRGAASYALDLELIIVPEGSDSLVLSSKMLGPSAEKISGCLMYMGSSTTIISDKALKRQYFFADQKVLRLRNKDLRLLQPVTRLK